jgi:hypothetical protein
MFELKAKLVTADSAARIDFVETQRHAVAARSPDWAHAAMPGMLQVTTGSLDGMVAPSSLPTMTSSSGSHSLCEFTEETCPAGAAPGPNSARDHVHCSATIQLPRAVP